MPKIRMTEAPCRPESDHGEGDSGQGSVLLVANFNSNAGYAWQLIEQYWSWISSYLARSRRTTVLAYPKIDGLSEIIQDSPLKVVEVDCRDFSRTGRTRIRQLIRDHDIASAYFTDWPFLSRRYGWFRAQGVERIVMHDHTPGDRPATVGLRGALKAIAYHSPSMSCDRYVAATPFVMARMVSNARAPAERCVTVQNGIDTIDPAPGAREWVRTEFGLPPESTIIVLSSRAHPYKNVLFAVDCAAELRPVMRDAGLRFIFCGDGPDLERIKSAIDQRNLSEYFVCVGHRPDTRRIIGGCDIGLHPSKGEVGYSLSVLEFMSAGLPVVVPSNPSVSSAIENNKTGYIYPEGDVSAAVEVIETLISNEPRRRIGAAAREAARSSYDIEVTRASLIASVASFL